MSGFGQRENETTSNWLRRLIAEGAPADVRANVQAILEDEARRQQYIQQAAPSQQPAPATGVRKLRDALLRSNFQRPDEKVIGRIALKFAENLRALDTDEQCVDLYGMVAALPATNTRLAIYHQCNMTLNGEAFNGFPNLISANDEDGKQYVVKLLRIRDSPVAIAVRKSEILQEAETCRLLGLANSSHELSFPNIEIITVHQDDVAFEALKMPKYPGVLVHAARFSPKAIFNQGQALQTAVKFMHSRGILHMDIKGANVFIDMNGKWLLGDFGSSCPIGNRVTSATELFCKERVVNKFGRVEFDWFMLLVMLTVETFDDRHGFRSKLYVGDSMYVSVEKLREAIEAVEDENVRLLLHEIQSLVGEYFSC